MLVVIKDGLVNDATLKNRAPLSQEDITKLPVLCLKFIYFHFQDQDYLQIHGAAMGSLRLSLTYIWRNLRNGRWNLLHTNQAGGNVIHKWSS